MFFWQKLIIRSFEDAKLTAWFNIISQSIICLRNICEYTIVYNTYNTSSSQYFTIKLTKNLGRFLTCNRIIRTKIVEWCNDNLITPQSCNRLFIFWISNQILWWLTRKYLSQSSRRSNIWSSWSQSNYHSATLCMQKTTYTQSYNQIGISTNSSIWNIKHHKNLRQYYKSKWLALAEPTIAQSKILYFWIISQPSAFSNTI